MSSTGRDSVIALVSQLPDFESTEHVGGFVADTNLTVEIAEGPNKSKRIDKVKKANRVMTQRHRNGYQQSELVSRTSIRQNAVLCTLIYAIPGMLVYRNLAEGEDPALGTGPYGMVPKEAVFGIRAAMDQELLTSNLIDGQLPDFSTNPKTYWTAIGDLCADKHALITNRGPASIRSMRVILRTNKDGVGWVETVGTQPPSGYLFDVASGETLATRVNRADSGADGTPMIGPVHCLELETEHDSIDIGELFVRPRDKSPDIPKKRPNPKI
ncbi:MAG: hypothetical protein JO002_05750 [Burkholderiaceae bacterium]|nr:hypothetical protein [Burkholderiaceae bacterium]